MPQDEAWSWLKFFKGFFIGKNYAKAIVIGTCQAVILVIITCMFLTAKNIIARNQGTIVQTDSHAKTENKNWNMFTLFKIG